MKILLADSLLIIFFAMSLIVSLHGFEFKVCFANSIRIHYLFWDYTKNSPSVSRIQFKFTFFIGVILKIHYFFANIQWIHDVFRDSLCYDNFFTNLRWIHYPFFELTMNSLPISEDTVNSPSISKIHYLLSEYTISVSRIPRKR